MQAIPLAIISNGMPPYRLHLHSRIAGEMPELELFSIMTHDDGTSNWEVQLPAEIRPHHFGPGEPSALQSKPSRAAHEFRKGGRIIRFLRAHGVRAVVVNGYNDPGRLRIIHWCKKRGIACFISGDSNIRGDNASGLRRRAKRALLGWLTGSVTGVLPCGSLGKQYFERYGADPARIWFFPVEPDYEMIEGLPSNHIELVRARFGLDPLRRRFVYSGRLIELKRVDLLIDAFNEIASERPEWDLVIVGDGPLRESLQQRVGAGLTARVIWAGFQSDQHDVAAIYRCCDALVLPSDYDAWGLVVNEAAACGLALVCSDVIGAAAELLRGGENGRLFPKGDLGGLRDALLDVSHRRNIQRYRQASFEVLQRWRDEADTVSNLRQALAVAGIFHHVTAQ